MIKGLKECTTLCYLEKDDAYLLMHRTKKKDDENSGKYIGIGGHVEENETPEECLIREVKEETGLTLCDYKLRGLITFSFEDKDEIAFLYTSNNFVGELIKECKEGELVWVKKDAILSLPLWAGDKLFLEKLKEDRNYFSLKLNYKKDKLLDYKFY